MKKALSLLLAVIMVMSLVACGGNNTANNGKTNDAGKTDTNTQKQPTTQMDEAQGTKVESTKDETAEYAKEITIDVAAPKKLDPTDAWNAGYEAYERLVFDTLLYVDDMTGETEMLIAETVEWDGDDCTRVHVVLKDGIKFSNGEPLTAADCEYSFSRHTYGSFTASYESCDIVSDTEFYINLKKPTASFITLLSRACAMIVCKSAAEAHPDKLALIGSGPYQYDMDTFVADNSIDLVRNEYFWGEKNPTDVFHITHIADYSAAAVALGNEDINFMINVNETERESMDAKDNVAVQVYNAHNIIYMCFEDFGDSTTISEEEIWFRRAVASGFSKEDIVTGIGGGMAMVSMWPYGDKDAYIASESEYEYDHSYNVEQAKEYLAKAGGKTEFTCLVDTSKAWCKLAAQVMIAQLAEVGITMNIEETDATGFSNMTKWDRAKENCYDAYLQSNLFVVDAVNSNYYAAKNNINRPRMNNPEIEAALEGFFAASDPVERVGFLKELQRQNHDVTVAYVPIAFRQMNYAYTEGLENFSVAAGPTYWLRNVCLRTN